MFGLCVRAARRADTHLPRNLHRRGREKSINSGFFFLCFKASCLGLYALFDCVKTRQARLSPGRFIISGFSAQLFESITCDQLNDYFLYRADKTGILKSLCLAASCCAF